MAMMKYMGKYLRGKFAISEDEVKQYSLNDEMLSDMAGALDSGDNVDSIMAFYFLAVLIPKNKLPSSSLKSKNILAAVKNAAVNGCHDVRSSAVEALISARLQYPDYKSIMIKLLNDSSVAVRAKVLNAASTFLEPHQVSPLFAFSQDKSISEVGMGGRLIFDLRNQAFEVVEAKAQCSFPRVCIFETVGNQNVCFWSWAPILRWWRFRKLWWR